MMSKAVDFKIDAISTVTATDVKKHSQAQGGRPLPPLQKSDVVRLRDAAWSRKAQVVGSPYPRSYLVKTEDQKLLRRNLRRLLQTGERFIEESDDDIDTSSADNNVGGHPTVATSTSPANGRRREVPTSGDPSPPVETGCHQLWAKGDMKDNVR
ncbi:hypothetical protein MRX96_036487 [Rhipicephalus microplus]